MWYASMVRPSVDIGVALLSFRSSRMFLCFRCTSCTCFLADLRAGLADRGRRGARLRPAVGLRADPRRWRSRSASSSSAASVAASCPPTVADTLRPHAERVLAAVEEARRAVQSVRSLETGTIRFGMFGTARLYAGAGLVADVLARYPGVRVELIGQNSTDVQEDLRRGRLEAAMIAVPTVDERGDGGHAGGPRRARLHQRRPRAARRRRSPRTGSRWRRW